MAHHIRPGRLEDVAAITPWTSDTFSWGDYVPERLPSWLDPLAMMLIAFAALGEARTTRQGRGTAAAAAIVATVALRIAAFAALSLAGRSAAGVVLVYALPLTVIAVCLTLIFQGPRMKALGARLTRWGSLTLLPRVPLLGRA